MIGPMGNRVHTLAVPMDGGCTHVEEGPHQVERKVITVDGAPVEVTNALLRVRGGIVEDGVFVPKQPGANGQRTEFRDVLIGPADDAAFRAFQAWFRADEAQPARDLDDEAAACRLEYVQRRELGLLPNP